MQTTIRMAVGAVTVVVLSLPMVAHADQQNRVAYRDASSWIEARWAWPYRNQFPPCMATAPEIDPRYHGGTPGPTFSR
jgi:hypothetical protein